MLSRISSVLPLFVLLASTAVADEREDAPQAAGPTVGEQQPPVKISDQQVHSAKMREQPAHELGPRSFLRSFVHDQKQIWTSPTRISRGDSKWLISLAVATGIAISTDNRLSEHLPNPEDPAKIVGKQISQLGALYTVAGISAGTYLVGRFSGKNRLRDTGWLGLEALAHTQVVVQGMKLATQRERPPEPTPRRGFWAGGSSFPSGHAASSWAWATVVARQYGDRKVVPITVYSLAAIVSGARLSARRHYASDVLVGGVIGHLIGRYIHESRQASGGRLGRGASLTPHVGVRYIRPARHYAVNLAWAF